MAAYARTWLENQVLEETNREAYQRTADRIVGHLGGMAREDVTPYLAHTFGWPSLGDA